MPILWAINHLKFKQLKLNGKQANRLKLGICAIKFCNKYAIHLVDVSQYLVATQFEIRAIFSGEPFLSLVEWKSPLINTCANSQAKFNLQMASILHSQRLSLFSFGGFHDASFIIVCWRNHGSVKILQKPWQKFPALKNITAFRLFSKFMDSIQQLQSASTCWDFHREVGFYTQSPSIHSPTLRVSVLTLSEERGNECVGIYNCTYIYFLVWMHFYDLYCTYSSALIALPIIPAF